MKKILDRWMMRMMITCEKAAWLISKSQDQKLSIREAVQLKMHLLGCRFCRAYQKDIGILTEGIREFKEKSENGQILEMPSSGKEQIREKIRHHRGGHDHSHC